MNSKSIISYSTWKKKNNPEIREVRDGIKWWAVQTVCPTIEYYGWKQCIFDSYYRNWDGTKPKEHAIQLLINNWGENWLKGKKFVYYEYHGTNGYMDCMYVWYKEENEKDLDLDYYRKKYEKEN